MWKLICPAAHRCKIDLIVLPTRYHVRLILLHTSRLPARQVSLPLNCPCSTMRGEQYFSQLKFFATVGPEQRARPPIGDLKKRFVRTTRHKSVPIIDHTALVEEATRMVVVSDGAGASEGAPPSLSGYHAGELL